MRPRTSFSIVFALVLFQGATAIAQLARPANPLWEPVVDRVYLQEEPTHIPTDHPLATVAVHEGRAYVGDA